MKQLMFTKAQCIKITDYSNLDSRWFEVSQTRPSKITTENTKTFLGLRRINQDQQSNLHMQNDYRDPFTTLDYHEKFTNLDLF